MSILHPTARDFVDSVKLASITRIERGELRDVFVAVRESGYVHWHCAEVAETAVDFRKSKRSIASDGAELIDLYKAARTVADVETANGKVKGEVGRAQSVASDLARLHAAKMTLCEDVEQSNLEVTAAKARSFSTTLARIDGELTKSLSAMRQTPRKHQRAAVRRARLPSSAQPATQCRPVTPSGAFRRAGMTRLPPSRHAVHRRLRIPDLWRSQFRRWGCRVRAD